VSNKEIYAILKKISKYVCLDLCPYSLVDCPSDCKFQKYLIQVIQELDKK